MKVQVEIVPKLIPVFQGDCRYRGAHGGRGCVHPDTLIDTPSGQIPIKDFKGGLVWSYMDGRRVPAHATPAKPYTEEDLYQVEFEDGSSIIVTDEHKFLTNNGWIELQDLSISTRVAVYSTDFNYLSIRLIRKHSRQIYWDLHVYGTNNYLSNGIVNHNSGKTRSFAKMAAVRGVMLAQSNQIGIILCGREFQKTLEESSFAEVRAAIESEPWLKDLYDIGDHYIKTKCGRISFSFQGLKRNIDSIKSKSRILILWVDEAEQVSEECWRKITPTVREQGSEIWITWNPETDGSATDERFLKNPPSNSKIVQVNWRDNPWFNETLNQERLDDKEKRPHSYSHVWEGEYLDVMESAYYTNQIIKAKHEKRWGIDIMEDPLLTMRVWCDIGGTGARADNFVFWVGQFIGDWINYTNHYEVQGQPIQAHLEWLRENNYTSERTQIWLPHDGSSKDRVYDASYESELRKAGYYVEVVPNQGKGAAKNRIEIMRDNFHRMRFDKKCEGGMKALAWYHEKIDHERRIGLGPAHDWACLPAGTKINTPYGPKSVEDFVCGDQVVTSGKVGAVTRAQAVKLSKVMTIHLNDGTTLQCSPEHKIFTRLGLVMAKDLCYLDVLLTEKEIKPWLASEKGIRKAFIESSKELGTTSGKSVDYTFHSLVVSRGCFTGSIGSISTAPLERLKLWFLSMATGRISILKIGCAGTMQKMDLSFNQSIPVSNSMEENITKHQTAPTTTTPSKMAEKPYCTEISTSSFMGRFLKGLKSTIRTLTRPIMTALTSKLFPSKSIVGFTLSEREIVVYDIEVETDHCYTLTNSNVVVSNSHSADAVAIAPITFRPPRQKKSHNRKPKMAIA